MIEDDQILLQNLSLTDQSPSSQSKTDQQLLLGVHQQQERQRNIITEKYKSNKYYIDWNRGENHQYFTKIIMEDIQIQTIHQQNNIQSQYQNTKINYQHYSALITQLENALNRIQKNNSIKNIDKSKFRSQSIQSNKQRQVLMFSKTGREFRTEYTNEKKIGNSRTKTEAEQSEKQKSKGINGKNQKYKMRHIITEQKQQSNIKQWKQNNLKNKFLASIALWQQKKEKKQQQRIQRQKKISMEGVTFTPELNPRSREIMKKKGTIAPIYQREGRQKKKELTERFNVQYKTNRPKY